MGKAVLYCRVDRPATEMSRGALEAQRHRLESYAAKHNIEIAGCYADDGFPGHTLDRPGLQALMRDAATGAFDSVLVVNRDRLFRGAVHAQPKELRELPVSVHSINALERSFER